MKYTYQTPRVPNFIKVDFCGEKEGQMLPLTSFDDDELNCIAEEWKKDLFENRDRQKNSEIAKVLVND